MLRKFFVAAAIVAAMAPLAEAAKAKARARVTPNRVKVQATTRQIMPTAKAGQGRWDFWDSRSQKANVTTTPAQRPN